MPTLTVWTSASLGEEQSRAVIESLTSQVAAAAGVPTGYVHVHICPNQLLSFGGELGLKEGEKSVTRVQVLMLEEQLENVAVKEAILLSINQCIDMFGSVATSQVFFEECRINQLAVQGKLLGC